MTTATYRGIKYNVEERKLNQLALIQEQLKKAAALKAARLQATSPKG